MGAPAGYRSRNMGAAKALQNIHAKRLTAFSKNGGGSINPKDSAPFFLFPESSILGVAAGLPI
jgi:hypothetical protein